VGFFIRTSSYIRVLTICSTLIAISILALWIRSYFCTVGIASVSPEQRQGMEISSGYVIIYHDWFFPEKGPSSDPRIHEAILRYYAESSESLSSAHQYGYGRATETSFLGIRFLRSDLIFARQKAGTRLVKIPIWFFTLVPTLFLVFRLRRKLILRLRGSRGHCLNCGYDLRGSGSKCSECGVARQFDMPAKSSIEPPSRAKS
jgi:hypothetical protein